jgi:hypothetical protein
VGLQQAWATSVLGRYEQKASANDGHGGDGVYVEARVRIWTNKIKESMAVEHDWANVGLSQSEAGGGADVFSYDARPARHVSRLRR